SPSGERVVYRARQGADFTADLYSISTAAGRDRNQSHAELAFARVLSSEISPDGRYVVYEATEAEATPVLIETALHSTPVEGGPTVRMSRPSDLRILDFAFAPVGGRLLYAADLPGDFRGVFSASVSGASVPIVLDALELDEGVPTDLAVSPDGAWGAYL